MPVWKPPLQNARRLERAVPVGQSVADAIAAYPATHLASISGHLL